MATDIDELQIQIQASAKGANSSVTALIKRLEKLSGVINGIDASKVNNLGTGINNVGKNSNTASVGLDKTAKSAKNAAKSFNSLASAFGKFYATYFLFIRGIKGLWKNVQSSMDYVETSNYFAVSLGQIGQQFEQAGYESAELYTEALTSELNKLNQKMTGYSVGASGEALFSGDVGLGMDIETLMNFQAKTLAVTNSVGLMGEASIETAKAVSMLVGDISSLTNTDLETVMTNLSSGLIGQSRSLYKYGYDITQNTLQQYALAEGIEKAVSEMTQSEKMQLRLLAILDQSTVAQADLANTINSVANQYRVTTQQVGNLGRTLGNLFLPVVQNVLPYINGLIIALNNLFTSLGFEIYGDTWLEDLQQGISGGVQGGFEDLEGSVEDATESINEFKKGVRGFDELNVLSSGSGIGSGITDELEGTIDLTDSITQAVADYENSWNKAFATAENKASEFAKKLEDDFKDVADLFDRIFPAIIGIGGAIATYKIASGVGGIVSSLANLGSPLGYASLAAGVLIGVGTAIKKVHDDAVKADLESRFGDIALSLEEIEKVAKYILNNNNVSKVSNLLSEISDLSGIQSSIDDSVTTLNKLNWKVSVGMELTEEDESTYKKAIDSYVSSVNDYVVQQQYAAAIGIKLFLGDSQTSEEVQSVVNQFYNSQNEKLRQLGEDLNKVTTDAWNDGLLSIDEVEAISNIQTQMAEIQSAIARSQTQAKFQLLEESFSGSELTPESYKKLLEERNEIFAEYESDYNESLVFSLGQINLAYEAKINDAETEEAKKQIREEWNNVVKETISARDAAVAEMQLNAFSFDYNTLLGTYGEAINNATNDLTDSLKRYAKMYAEGNTNAEYMTYLRFGILEDNFKEIAGEYGYESFSKLLDVMAPSSELEKTAQSIYEMTGQIPQAMADALASQYALEAISGNASSLYKLLLASAEDDAIDEILLEIKEKGWNVPEFLAKGVVDNAEVVTDSIDNLFNGLEESLDSQGLLDTAENLGKEFAKSFVNGTQSISQFTFGVNFSNTPIEFRANGGMVTSGQVFVARENGISEYVGNFGGQVGVANNDQITQAIKQAAYEGFLAAMSQGGSSGGVTVVLEGDAAGVFKLVKQEERNNYKRTGNSVFVH